MEMRMLYAHRATLPVAAAAAEEASRTYVDRENGRRELPREEDAHDE